MTATVLLVEDQTLTRKGMRALLDDSPELKIIGEASNGREAVELAGTLNPDVVLMDVAMPQLNGIEATRQIHSAQPDTRIIMLSMHKDRQYVFESLKAGASGYVPKDAAYTELITAIETVMSGRTYLPPPLQDMIMDDYAQRAQGKQISTDLEKLSGREREVLQLIGEGNSSMEIARLLHISVRTVDTHRQNIMGKLEIRTIAGLTKFAIRHGLCSL